MSLKAYENPCGLPYSLEEITQANGSYTPSTIRPHDNAAFFFWCRALYERLEAKIDFSLPEEWGGSRADFFKDVMLTRGFCTVFYSDVFGLSFQPCTLNGYDFYYQPTQAIVSNPLLSATLRIGEDCQLLKLTSGYHGVYDVVMYYAEQLALMKRGINTGIINNLLSWVLGAKNRSAANALKKIFDKVNRGDPVVIFDQRIMDDPNTKDMPFTFLERRVSPKDGYITTEQLQDVQTIINQFDAEIGIITSPYQKQDRLTQYEAESKHDDAQARCTHWMETFNSSAQLVNEMFGTNIKMSLRMTGSVQERGGASGADTWDALGVQPGGASTEEGQD